MKSVQTGMLQVPGARIYYEVRGSGPLLLVLQGADGDASGSVALVDQLVNHYTVVVYDRRGLSRSTYDEGATPPGIHTHSDDVHCLLDALTTEPALVLGISIGGLIGLELVARYPYQVRTLLAHEPPAMALLPDEERIPIERFYEEVEETHRQKGLLAAMRLDMGMLRMDFSDREPDVVLPPPPPQRNDNLEVFRKYDSPASQVFKPDIEALRRTTTRIIFAAGERSRGIWPFRTTEVLAGLLGKEILEFPGGHNGPVLHPRAVASRLRDVLV